jgi:uncharacterized DUF497 family protein
MKLSRHSRTPRHSTGDLAHSEKEPQSKRLGESFLGRVLLVIYTIQRAKDGEETIRAISARQASREERKAYAELAD